MRAHAAPLASCLAASAVSHNNFDDAHTACVQHTAPLASHLAASAVSHDNFDNTHCVCATHIHVSAVCVLYVRSIRDIARVRDIVHMYVCTLCVRYMYLTPDLTHVRVYSVCV